MNPERRVQANFWWQRKFRAPNDTKALWSKVPCPMAVGQPGFLTSAGESHTTCWDTPNGRRGDEEDTRDLASQGALHGRGNEYGSLANASGVPSLRIYVQTCCNCTRLHLKVSVAPVHMKVAPRELFL